MIYRYANEARIVWNAPLQHEADAFLKESLDDYFGDGKWHFWSIDKKRRQLVTITSKVIDRKLKETSKISFLTSKKR
jgi:hypothetical protein